jgi:hypothetical protein
MLEAGEHDGVRGSVAPSATGARVEIGLDLDDRRHRVAHLAEELQAHRADRLRRPVQDEARGGDNPVAAFLLHPWEAGEELVGNVLAKADLAELPAGDL